MSYVLIGYLVDIPKLETIIGSKDPSAVEAVIDNNPEEFEEDEERLENDEDYEDDEADGDDGLTLGTALRQLMLGKEMDSEEAHQYGYALKTICECYGESLHCQEWNGVRWTAVEVCGLNDLLTKTGPPIKLPPIADFPAIGHIRRRDLGPYLQAARQRFADSPDTDAQDLLDEYIDWLEAAESQALDLVFFYH